MKKLRMFSIGYKQVAYSLPADSWIEQFAVGSLAESNLNSLHDNGLGDSLAHLNPSFGELTAQYWAWKHLENVDYIGFCHYRRYFNFINALDSTHPKLLAEPNPQIMHYIASKDQRDAALNILEHCDIIATRSYILANSIAQQFRESHGGEIWEKFINSIADISPAWLKAYTPWLEFSQEARFYPIYIMPWNEFDRFCSLLFPLLLRIHHDIGDIPHVPGLRFQPNRYPAYLAERFMMLYFHARGLRVHGAQLIALESDA